MSWFIHLLLFGLALIVLPFGASHFEIPKVIVAEIAIQVLAVWYVLRGKPHPHPLWAIWPLVGIFILSAYQLLAFGSLDVFFGNAFRLQGVFLLWHLLLFAFLTSRIDHTRVSPWLPTLTLAALAGTVYWYGTNAAGRAVGALGEPNALAAVSVFCYPFLFLHKPARRMHAVVLGMIAMIFILYLTRSRSGMVAFAVQLVFLFITHVKIVSLRRGFIISLFLIGLAMFLPFFEANRFFENRVEIWQTALTAGQRYPLFGWGFGAAEKGIAWGARQLENPVRYQYVDSSHNMLIDWWVQGGLVALFLLVHMLLHTARSFIRHADTIHLTALLGVLATLMFNPLSVVSILALWWCIGRGYGHHD